MKKFIFMLESVHIHIDWSHGDSTGGKADAGNTIEIGVLSGMFFLLAFAMIVPWRIAMLYQYKKVKAASFGGGSMV